MLVGVTTLAILATGGLAWSLRSTDTESCADGRTPLRVTVAPDLAPVVTTLAGRLSADAASCVDVAVTASAPQDVLRQLQDGSIQPPDVWVPNSTLWLTRAKDDRVAAATDAPSIATSPLVLAVDSAGAQRLRRTGRPTVADLAAAAGNGKATIQVAAERLAPERVGTILALRAATQARPDGRAALTALLRAATVAGASGGAGSTTGAPGIPAGGPVAKPTATPMSEQAVWARNALGGRGLVAIYPGQATYDYPYAVLTTSPATQAAAGQLLDRLTMPSSQQAIRSAGFRDGTGRPGFDLTAARGVDGLQSAAPVRLDAESLAQAERTLDAVRLDARLLAVVDVSGSMAWGLAGKAAKGPSRLSIAQEAALRGMGFYPATTEVGLWAFSQDVDGPRDFRQVVATTALDAAGRRRLAAGVASLRPQGETALYSTTLAAVRAAQRGYSPGKVNAVVLLSDGADTEGTLTLGQVVRTLKTERRADRPVPVITIAFGPDADTAALKAIAGATGGASYRATSPDQVRQVFLDAVGQRACRPSCG